MYELTCPSCHQSLRLPFVRVGARSVCGQCHFAWKIKKEHFSRQVQPAGVAGETDPLAAVGASTPPPPTHAGSVLPGRTGAGLSSAGVSGTNSGSKSGTGSGAPSKPTGAAGVVSAATLLAEAAAARMTTIPSTAVPTATAAGARTVPPVSRLIATRMRQKRRRQMVTWLTLVIVVLLSGIIAAVLVGLNHDNVDDELAAATPAQPQVTQPLFRVGPPQWKEVEEMAYTTLRSGPLGLEDHALVAAGNQGDFMLVGSVVCSSFDLYPDARLSLMLIDGDQLIYARTDIALPPMNGQRDFSRQPISILIPSHLHQRLSNLEWEIIPGKPLNDGVMMNPNRIIRMDSSKETKLKLIYLNRMSRPIFKLALSIRAVDGHGKTHAHWAGNWQGMIEPGQALELVVPTPLTDAMPDIRDWQVQSAADLATRPVEMPALQDEP